ncbi:MAG: UDP-glucose 4-epimerase GalE [Clostridiales bacterium]|nr:UDP-glucose 4-epimerase GalE [Clostridiales bacterium]
MTILVCGGAGYIGSHCVRQLQAAGYPCVVYDNLSTGHRASVGGCELVEGDLRDRDKLKQVLLASGAEGVIHLAAFSLVGESIAEPLMYYENNLCGAISLLGAMKDSGVDKLVFSSTAAVYGEPEVVPVTEDSGALPVNPYGETKLAIEKLLHWCDGAYGIKSVSLRYFNAAGAAPEGNIGEDHRRETHLIPLVLQEALRQNGSLQVFGNDYPTRDGSCARDYVHVLDLADAHIRAFEYLKNGNASDYFNLGAGHGATVLEVIQTARQVTGVDINYTISGRRAGDPAALTANAEKAARILGWAPARSDFRRIIQDAWAWHRSHPRGYED